MFGRNKRENEVRQRASKFMNSPIAQRLAEAALEAIARTINFRSESRSLELLGADVTIAIDYWKSSTCEITSFGVRRTFDLPRMTSLEYCSLAEAVGFIVAPKVKEYLERRVYIRNPDVGIYAEHVGTTRAAVSVIYGDCDDDGARIG